MSSSPPFPGGASITQFWDPSIGEYGDDFGLSPGTAITAPDLGPGVITAEESRGKSAWGRRIQETFLSGPFKGWSFDVGHLTSFGPSMGSIVEPGQLLGFSGGALSDPQSGNTTGPHIEPQLQDPSGRYHNPLSFLQSLFGGRQPAVPTDPGVSGPAFVGKGSADTGVTLYDFVGPFGEKETLHIPANFGSNVVSGLSGSGPSLINFPNPFAGLSGWISSQGHTFETWAVANIIALVVAALILLVVFAGSPGSGSSAPRRKTRVVPV